MRRLDLRGHRVEPGARGLRAYLEQLGSMCFTEDREGKDEPQQDRREPQAGATGSFLAFYHEIDAALVLLDGFETTRESVAGALPGLPRAAGFEGVEETAKFDTPLGTMRLMRAVRPRLPPSRKSAA